MGSGEWCCLGGWVLLGGWCVYRSAVSVSIAVVLISIVFDGGSICVFRTSSRLEVCVLLWVVVIEVLTVVTGAAVAEFVIIFNDGDDHGGNIRKGGDTLKLST